MKHFKIYAFLLLAFGILTTGCEDNYDTKEPPVTTTSEPTEIEGVGITGFVVDSDSNPIADAEIVILHDEKALTVTTDASGRYEVGLPDVSERVYLQAKAENYVTSGIKDLALTQMTNEKDIILLQPGDFEQAGEVLPIGSGSLAVLSGRVLLANGDPAAFHRITLLGFPDEGVGSFIDLIFTYDVTDAEGYYSIAHEPFENWALAVGNDCLESEVISVMMSMGDSDVDLGTYQSNLQGDLDFEVSGFITDCKTGLGLEQGWLTISVEGHEDNIRLEVIDGVYSVMITNCQSASCFDVTLISTGASAGWNKVECVSIEKETVFDHTLCGDERDIDGNIEMAWDTEVWSSPLATASIESEPGQPEGWGIGVADLATGRNFYMQCVGTEVGTYDISLMVFWEGEIQSPILFVAAQGGLGQIVIEEVSDRLVGTFSGVAANFNNEEFDFTGTFDIKL